MIDVVLLMTLGIYLLLDRTSDWFGYIICGQAINLFLIKMNVVTNLLEQSIILTSIVIGLGSAFLLLRKK
ncbi:MAG: hypothetical protein H6845_02315 [Alphaproteobacteria bacterium]|nr:MAG: hypothetical protein H6845_02315 [Alphaproteobacteria bacterium]